MKGYPQEFPGEQCCCIMRTQIIHTWIGWGWALHIREVHPLLHCRWTTEVLTNSTSFVWASDSHVFLEHRISCPAWLQYSSQWLEVEYNVATSLIFMEEHELCSTHWENHRYGPPGMHYKILLWLWSNSVEMFFSTLPRTQTWCTFKKKKKPKGC